jgi:hypothetical protein
VVREGREKTEMARRAANGFAVRCCGIRKLSCLSVILVQGAPEANSFAVGISALCAPLLTTFSTYLLGPPVGPVDNNYRTLNIFTPSLLLAPEDLRGLKMSCQGHPAFCN